MRYSYSDVDKKNHEWFQNDINSKSLKTIQMDRGQIRGLHPCKINFTYPISAIAGENGSGKSTLLALACCAYHNVSYGYIPIDRNKPYYTFSDFFVQTIDEMKVDGILILYEFLAKWKGGLEGPGWHYRIKNVEENGINTTIVYAEMSSSSVFKESFRPENVKLNVLILVSSNPLLSIKTPKIEY